MKTAARPIIVAISLVFFGSALVNSSAQLPLPLRGRRVTPPRVTRPARAGDPNTASPEIEPVVEKVVAGPDIIERAKPAQPAEATGLAARERLDSVRTADFYLKNGKLVFGKLVDEDRNKVTIEQLEGSKIIVATYSKRDIEPRSLQVKTISASRYYQDLAEYFAGRVWDFEDDPDDFIQAIRCYTKARSMLTVKSQMDAERLAQIDKQIAALEADRKVWEKQIESRARLKELEFQSEFVKRFEQLEAKLDATTQQINENIAEVNALAATLQQNQQKLEESFPRFEQEIRRELAILGDGIEANRRMIDPYRPFGRRDFRYYGPRY